MKELSCLNCGVVFEFNKMEGDGYFFGYDTDYYGDSIEERDPHQVIGHYCKPCGENLRNRAEGLE